MGILISEAIRNGIITNETCELIPKHCKCGSELSFSDSLRDLICTNKKCVYTIINRIKKFCDVLNIQLLDNEIENIVKTLGITTPYQIMLLYDAYNNKSNKVELLNIHDKDSLLQSIEKVKQTDFLLYEIAELCNIENISKIAYKLFNGFNSIDEAYDEIEVGQLAFINERLGINNQDSSIISLEIYNELISAKEELIFGESVLNLKQDNKRKMNIAFADNVNPYINIGELIEFLNNKYEYRFNHVAVINENTDLIVRNGDSNNNKYRAARLINDKYVAELMNNNKISLSDIGKFRDNELKPIGSKIYIDTLENIINRLDRCHNGE